MCSKRRDALGFTREKTLVFSCMISSGKRIYCWEPILSFKRRPYFDRVQSINVWLLGLAKRKRVFGHMRTAKVKISLRIRAVWSGPSLSANRIIGYRGMYEWRAKARMILCACAGWSEFAYFAHVRRHFFAWRGSCKELQVALKCWILLIFIKGSIFLKIDIFFFLSKKVLMNWYMVLIRS